MHGCRVRGGEVAVHQKGRFWGFPRLGEVADVAKVAISCKVLDITEWARKQRLPETDQ
jgi:hypothetical protein